MTCPTGFGLNECEKFCCLFISFLILYSKMANIISQYITSKCLLSKNTDISMHLISSDYKAVLMCTVNCLKGERC